MEATERKKKERGERKSGRARRKGRKTHVVGTELVPEVLGDVLDVVRLVGVAGHVLDNADARREVRLQDVHLAQDFSLRSAITSGRWMNALCSGTK